MFKRLEW